MTAPLSVVPIPGSRWQTIWLENTELESVDRPEWAESSSHESGKLALVWIGRISRQKDFAMFLDLAIWLDSRQRLASARVYGTVDSDCSQLLDHAAVQQGRVEIFGFRRISEESFTENSVLCLFSHFEGRPLVLDDAIACHLPVVASDLPGISMAIGNGFFLVNKLDEAGAACLKLSSRSARADVRSAQRRAYVQARGRFENSHSALERIYERIGAR
ncbi:glycosyltransferase [Rhodococcus sp. NPDC003994]